MGEEQDREQWKCLDVRCVKEEGERDVGRETRHLQNPQFLKQVRTSLSDSPNQQINYTAENNDESNGRRFLSDGGTVGHGKSCSKNRQKISRPILNTRRLEKGESSMSNYYDDSRRLLSAKNLSISTTSSSSSLAIIPFEQQKEQPNYNYNKNGNSNKQREKATAEEKGKKVATLLDTKKRSKSFHSRFPPTADESNRRRFRSDGGTDGHERPNGQVGMIGYGVIQVPYDKLSEWAKNARDQGPPVGMIGYEERQEGSIPIKSERKKTEKLRSLLSQPHK
ncbi:hypothetical protein niasHT_018571 [Heterodera trifolii]|uniref:Uncharacterized protein n=1 Tax=Heterodera trifolii TaxID=157864 RepID=A0ABD2LBG1_9BILA